MQYKQNGNCPLENVIENELFETNNFISSGGILSIAVEYCLCNKRLVDTVRQGILKGEVSLYLLFDWFGICCMTTDDFCFYLQNRLIPTGQTGDQWYSDTSPFSIPWMRSGS